MIVLACLLVYIAGVVYLDYRLHCRRFMREHGLKCVRREGGGWKYVKAD